MPPTHTLLFLALPLCCLAAASPSEPDIKGRAHPPLQPPGQPLGDDGDWYTLDVAETRSAAGATLTKLPDGSILASGHRGERDAYTLTVKTTLRNIIAFKLEALPDDSLPRHGPGRASSGNFTLTRITLTQAPADKPDATRPLPLSDPQTDHAQQGYPATGALDNIEDTGWSIGAGGHPHYLTFKPAQTVADTQNTLLTFRLEFNHPSRKGYALGHLRLSATTGTPPAEAQPKLQPPQARAAAGGQPPTKVAPKSTPAKPRFELNYKLGPEPFTDPQGRKWVPAHRWKDGQDGYIGGSVQTSLNSTDPLLRKAVSGIDGFRALLPNGKYKVSLIFAEIRPNAAAGYRRFNVRIQNVQVLRDFDPLAKAGGIDKPFVHAEPSVPITDGLLRIDFTGEKPLLNAITITAAD